jgi:hypothetical protein
VVYLIVLFRDQTVYRLRGQIRIAVEDIDKAMRPIK